MELIAVIAQLHQDGSVKEVFDDVLTEEHDITWRKFFQEAIDSEGYGIDQPGIYLGWYYDMDNGDVFDSLVHDVVFTVSKKAGKLVANKGLQIAAPKVHRWPPRDDKP